ncbi:MAG: hypothetical protein GY797_24900, partial [Deltaproteobacteria bacterium]|nr:hypothetical protein [Deltaproteobacteria bacterium]
MKIRIFRCKTFCILSFLVFSGCATIPGITNLKQHKSFTRDEIVAGMMGVGGVVSIVNDLDPLAGGKYADILRDSLLSVREEFVILPVEEVVQRLEKDHYQAISHNYKYTGKLDLDLLKKLDSSQTAFRYLLLVRIIENEITKTREKSPRPEIPPRWDLEGNPIVKEIAVELITTRRIGASLDIYDLKKKIPVFSGMINESKSKERTAYIEKKDEGIGRMFALIPVRAFLEVALEPSAPRTDKLLR